MSSSAEFTHAAFARALREHKLVATRSASSGALYVPPRPLGPGQTACDMEWVQLEGTGTLEAFSIIYIAPSAMLREGYGRDNPYCAGIVRLAEGPAISAQILGVDVRRPESIRVGAPATVEFIDAGEGDARTTRLAFRLH
jgi:uncharacterized OB-fold protein